MEKKKDAYICRWYFWTFAVFNVNTKHTSTLFAQTNGKKHNSQLFAGLQILHQHPQPDLSDTATHGTAARLHHQNLQFGASSCVSTRSSHIHINGLFVLRVLATAHRQECLRGEQWRLAGAPLLLSQQRRNSARDLTLVPNRSPSSKGWLVKKGAIWEWLQATDHNGTDHTANPLDPTQIQPHYQPLSAQRNNMNT